MLKQGCNVNDVQQIKRLMNVEGQDATTIGFRIGVAAPVVQSFIDTFRAEAEAEAEAEVEVEEVAAGKPKRGRSAAASDFEPVE